MRKEYYSLADCISIAKRMTKSYSKNHVGKTRLEKECIKKGYLVKRYKEIFADCIEEEREKHGVFALSFNSVAHKGGFVLVR